MRATQKFYQANQMKETYLIYIRSYVLEPRFGGLGFTQTLHAILVNLTKRVQHALLVNEIGTGQMGSHLNFTNGEEKTQTTKVAVRCYGLEWMDLVIWVAHINITSSVKQKVSFIHHIVNFVNLIVISLIQLLACNKKQTIVFFMKCFYICYGCVANRSHDMKKIF